jgi:predicted lipid-binding transport protein (Tim44 family)
VERRRDRLRDRRHALQHDRRDAQIADGTVVEAIPRCGTEATEVWTFLRSRGGNWILSAIQQG